MSGMIICPDADVPGNLSRAVVRKKMVFFLH